MLSRLAEGLFWIGRYVERAEDTARLLEVLIHTVIEDSPVDVATTCRDLLTAMGIPVGAGVVTVADVLELLLYSPASQASVVTSLAAARDNARGARDVIPSEMFSCLNRVHNRLPVEVERARRSGPDPMLAWVRSATAELAGLLDATMTRDEGWHFLVLGRSLERVDITARLISTRTGSSALPPWVTLLRSCGAYEAHLRTCRGVLEPARVAEFLLLDRLFPRSVFATLRTAEECLGALHPQLGRAGVADEGLRVLGRARASLEFMDPHDLLDRLPAELELLRTAVVEAAEAVARRSFQGGQPLAWHQEATG